LIGIPEDGATAFPENLFSLRTAHRKIPVDRREQNMSEIDDFSCRDRIVHFVFV
jgi:hypothetical protein